VGIVLFSERASRTGIIISPLPKADNGLVLGRLAFFAP
jgi:hypothetical protein